MAEKLIRIILQPDGKHLALTVFEDAKPSLVGLTTKITRQYHGPYMFLEWSVSGPDEKEYVTYRSDWEED